MSSACTCHIDEALCWYCLYENQRQINIKYEKALKEIVEMPYGLREVMVKKAKEALKGL